MCWNCGTAKDGTPDPTFRNEAAEEERYFEQKREDTGKRSTFKCLRCRKGLNYLGRRSFEQGRQSSSDPIGFAVDLLSAVFCHQEHLDVYSCPQCGKVELFVDGIGEDQRS
jgi:hypothetical protein